ncbi:NCS1 family transporter [Neobacillus mesonae]|uniref:NCS1 family transporter n=1 Tax=Neobacillus mesonae TaxID=1193713 RepID=UPI002E1F3DEE|nr:NCS1 family transporter [Neobacillus mesonae]
MNKKNNLIKKDNIPIPHSSRNVGMLGYSFVWVGIAVIIATFALGGDGVQTMKLGWVLLACLLANIVLGFFISITGDIGIEHGINFPVYMRAPFGVIGSYIPMLVRAILGSFWFGIQTYFGALAINYIFLHFTGFDNWLVWYIVFTIAQVINTAMGFKAIERFSNIAAPCIIIISIWMYFNLEGVASAAGNNVWNTVLGSDDKGFIWNTFIVLFFVNMAFWSTAASDSQNLTRYVKTSQFEKKWLKRNKNTLLGHMVALPLTQSAMIVIGGVSMIAVNNWNPVEAIQTTATGFILIVLLVMVVFAQWSTNAASNLLTPATVFAEVFPKIGYAGGVVLTAIVGSIIQPWALMEVLTDFLNIMSSVYSAIVGILFADYYLLRKRRMNIPELYKKEGQFSYAKGWNLAGIISLVIGMGVATLFSSYAFIVGFVASFIPYYYLGKYWWFKKYKQAEIEENYSDIYLGVTSGRDWVLDSERNEIVPSTSGTTREHVVTGFEPIPSGQGVKDF